MMTGQLYIDGKDVFQEFGFGILKGGHNELLAYPPLKTVKYNDWQEFDGIEADLSNPVLDTRSVSIKFGDWRNIRGLGDFVGLLSDGAYHTFYFGLLKRKYRLRLVSHPNMDWAQKLGFITLKFADDFPLSDYTYKAPQSGISAYGDFAIDDKLLTDYGVRVLKGTLASIDKSPDVKQNLLRNINSISGAEYDSKRVTFKSKEVQINCLMRAESMEEFWRNYDALLYDLTRPDERRLFVDARGKEYPCYYKSCKTNEFFPTGKIWWEFTLTLVFTNYRLRGKIPTLRLVSDGTFRLTSDGNLRLT